MFTPDGRLDPTVPPCPQKPVSCAPCSAPAPLCVQLETLCKFPALRVAEPGREESTSIKHGDRGGARTEQGCSVIKSRVVLKI